MSSLEHIETKIAFLEKANTELGDVVYRQQQEIEALRQRVEGLAGLMAAAAESATVYTEEEEKPPHY